MSMLARVLAAAGLGVDSYVHFDLAAVFDGNHAAISQGALFRGEAVVAALAAILVLITARRAVVGFAALVAGSALAAVLLYRYVDVGALGPLPDMYEPAWYPEKSLTGVAEAVALLASALALTPAFSGLSGVIRQK